MRKPLFVPLAAAAVLAAQPALASAAAPAPTPAQDFGKCAAKKYEGAELLATAPGSDEEAEVLAEFERRGCRRPTRDLALLRGAVAEQLFLADFGSLRARPRREEIEIFAALAPEEYAGLAEDARRRVDLLAVGTCVALADPKKASRLLGTAPAGADETQLISEFGPALSSCVSQGQSLNLGKAELRGLLAEGVYRIALTQTMDPDTIVVTADSDITCRTGFVIGTRLRERICMTEAQWEEEEREQFRKIEIIERTQERLDRAEKVTNSAPQ